MKLNITLLLLILTICVLSTMSEFSKKKKEKNLNEKSNTFKQIKFQHRCNPKDDQCEEPLKCKNNDIRWNNDKKTLEWTYACLSKKFKRHKYFWCVHKLIGTNCDKGLTCCRTGSCRRNGLNWTYAQLKAEFNIQQEYKNVPKEAGVCVVEDGRPCKEDEDCASGGCSRKNKTCHETDPQTIAKDI